VGAGVAVVVGVSVGVAAVVGDAERLAVGAGLAVEILVGDVVGVLTGADPRRESFAAIRGLGDENGGVGAPVFVLPGPH
jgi:hypothetical protein